MYLAKLSSFPEIQENVVSIITGSIRKLIKLEFFIEWKAPFELRQVHYSHPIGWFTVNMCCFKVDLKTLWRIQGDHTYWADETLMNMEKQ